MSYNFFPNVYKRFPVCVIGFKALTIFHASDDFDPPLWLSILEQHFTHIMFFSRILLILYFYISNLQYCYITIFDSFFYFSLIVLKAQMLLDPIADNDNNNNSIIRNCNKHVCICIPKTKVKYYVAPRKIHLF